MKGKAMFGAVETTDKLFVPMISIKSEGHEELVFMMTRAVATSQEAESVSKLVFAVLSGQMGIEKFKHHPGGVREKEVHS